MGDDIFGRYASETLEARGVGTSALGVDREWATSQTLIINVKGEDRRFIHFFGADSRRGSRCPGPDGHTGHVEMFWRDALIKFSPEAAAGSCRAPATSGKRSRVALYVYCDNVDALCERATAAGAKVERPPQNMFRGDRNCTLVDPDGHIWHFATNVADFDPSKAPVAARRR